MTIEEAHHLDRRACLNSITDYNKRFEPFTACVYLHEIVTHWYHKGQITQEEHEYYHAIVEGYAYGREHEHNEYINAIYDED